MGGVVSDPEVLGGRLVFAGTRVPVKALFDALKAGDSVADFLADFPTVSAERVRLVLEAAGSAVEAQAASFSKRDGLAGSSTPADPVASVKQP